MKKIILILFLSLLYNLSSAQEPLTYTKIIPVNGKSAVDLYSYSKKWFITSFVNPKQVIQIDDPTLNLISGNGSMEYSKGGLLYLSYDGWIKYTIAVQVKDNKIRVQLTNIIHENKPSYASASCLGLIKDVDVQFTSGSGKKYHNNVVDDIKNKSSILFNSISKSIEDFINSPNSTANDNW